MEVARLDADAGALVVAADDCGEGAAGAGAPPVWVKYADGVVDEVEREVREPEAAAGAPCAASLTSHCAAPCAGQVALISPTLRDLVLFDGAGGTHEAPLLLPKQVGRLTAAPRNAVA